MKKNTLTLICLAATALLVTSCTTTSLNKRADAPQTDAISVASFHKRATAGEPLRVVFFGGSLTWGANASDPLTTSYRGRMMQWMQEQYPNTPFRFFDAAIGGTGSQLGLFRLERDVLAHDPDLVFLDFTVNDGAGGDDIEQLTSYETLVRRMLEEDIAVVPVLMMFQWHVKEPGTELPKRHQGHIRLAEAYNLPVANTIPHVNQAIAEGHTTAKKLWPIDGVHPGDAGYARFFEAVRDTYLDAAAKAQLEAHIPENPFYGDYRSRTRRILSDAPLPEGWEAKITYRTSLWFDGLASRWIGEVATASKENESAALELEFDGSLVGFFGERNGYTPDVRIWIDGEPVLPPKAKDGNTVWHLATDRHAPSHKGSGNLFMWNLIADNLDDGPHHLKIEPIWEGADPSAELRIESICYAGDTQ